MANSKISDLTETTALADTDEFVVASSGATKRATWETLSGEIVWDEVIVKAVTESVSSSSTLQNDDELTFSVVSGGVYLIECVLAYNEPNNSGTPDFKFAFTMGAADPGSSYAVRTQAYINTSNAGAFSTTESVTTVISCGAAAIPRYAFSRIMVSAVDNGSFTLQWAQINSGGNAVRVLAGSFLAYRRIA